MWCVIFFRLSHTPLGKTLKTTLIHGLAVRVVTSREQVENDYMMHRNAYACTHGHALCMHMHTCVHTGPHLHMCVLMHTLAYMHACTLMYLYAYAYMHADTHVHMHTPYTRTQHEFRVSWASRFRSATFYPPMTQAVSGWERRRWWCASPKPHPVPTPNQDKTLLFL